MILDSLPKSKNSSLFVVEKQTTNDILKLVKRGVKDSKEQARSIAWYFQNKNKVQACKNIWSFLKSSIVYEKETKDLQTIKTLSRLLTQDKKGDCKHFSTATATLLSSLNIPYYYRLVSFNYYDKTPTHIYIVALVNNREIPIDCCMNTFNSEPSYKHKTDYKN